MLGLKFIYVSKMVPGHWEVIKKHNNTQETDNEIDLEENMSNNILQSLLCLLMA